MRLVLVILLSVLAVLFVAGVILWLRSPGAPPPLRGGDGRQVPGSLSERVTVEIGGVPQGMIIQSIDPANPVLLFLHGGPGMPEYFLEATHPAGLEQDFTVVWWEQRGAGMSWSPDLRAQDLTVDRMIRDTIEVADYLRDRFGQERIYLLGHSWGSLLGVQVAAQAPDRFHAYIGMAQVVHQLRSEIMARDAMLAAYGARGEMRMVRRLEAAPVSVENGMSDAYLRLRDAATHRLGGGTTRDMRSVITGVFLPILGLPIYILREKIDLWRGKAWSRGILWEEILRTDLSATVTRVQVPVYFLVGAHDLTAMPELSRRYFDVIEAPRKAYYVFENSAHSPLFEEPGPGRQVLLSIVEEQDN